MMIYNVTVSVDPEHINHWIKWMADEHIPEVLETGCFLSAKFTEVLAEGMGNNRSFSVQYRCASREELDRYYRNYAKPLREKTQSKFPNGVYAFRTELEVIGEFYPNQN